MLALVFGAIVAGCTPSYSDLQSAFGVDHLKVEPNLATHDVLVTGRKHAAAENYLGTARIHISDRAVEIAVDGAFLKPVRIPTHEIGGCVLACGIENDHEIDLLVPKTGTTITIHSSKKLLDWCWRNRRPMLPNDVANARA